MQRIEIANLYKNLRQDGQAVTLCGWAKTIRDSKKIGFIELTDGSCFKSLQVVFQADKLENYTEIAKAGTYTSLEVKGRKCPGADALISKRKRCPGNAGRSGAPTGRFAKNWVQVAAPGCSFAQGALTARSNCRVLWKRPGCVTFPDLCFSVILKIAQESSFVNQKSRLCLAFRAEK